MTYITIKSYSHFVNLNERTIHRHIEAKKISAYYDKALNRTFIAVEDLLKNSSIPLSDELALISEAEKGDAASRADIGLLFLEHHKPAEAIYWLQLAAEQAYADAMCLLADCYAKGLGVEKDKNLALMWLAKAANLGGVLATQQMTGLFID